MKVVFQESNDEHYHVNIIIMEGSVDEELLFP